MGTATDLPIWNAIAEAIPYIVGFVTGYLLFELTEWRRRNRRLATMRRVLQVELQTLEAGLSAAVFRCSVGTEHVARAVRELRHFYSEGRVRLLPIDPPTLPRDFLQRTDQELEEIVRHWRPMESAVAPGLATVVLDATLASQDSDLSQEQLQALMKVTWHAQLLRHDAEWMNHWLRMTFEIEDPDNHAAVGANHSQARQNYRGRAEVMLDAVREALRKLDSKPAGPVRLEDPTMLG